MAQNSVGPVVKDELPLTPEYVPDRLSGREQAVAEISSCLAPAASQRKPIHVWIHGASGSGKTAAARLAVMRLGRACPAAYVSCWTCRSFYAVLDALTADLHVLRAEEQRKAVRLRRLERHLGAAPCIIILDDLDLPAASEREDMLRSLASIGKVGLICISNSRKALLRLSEHVAARLNPRVVAFKPYAPEEILSILEERAQLALAPGTWTKAGLARIAELSCGSASLAIEILRAAAYAAEAGHEVCIRPAHIRDGRSRILADCEKSLAAGFTPHHALLWRLVREEGRIPYGNLRKAYLARCRAYKVTPIAGRTYSKYVSHLTGVGAILPAGRTRGSRTFLPAAHVPTHCS